MQGIGDVSGRAVELDFQRLGQSGQQRRAGAGRSGGGNGQQGPGQPPLGAPTGVQIDEAGRYMEIYKAWGSLVDYHAQMKASGIDVTRGPDPRIPGSYAAVSEWNRALAVYNGILERMQQANQNQKDYQKAVMAGDIIPSQAMATGEQGFTSNAEMLQEGVIADPQFIQRVNQILEQEPESEDEYNEQLAFYQRQVANIEQMYQGKQISEETRNHWHSLLRKPPQYNPLDDDLARAKIATEDARRRSANRANRPDKDDGPSNREALYPELSETVNMLNAIIDEGKYQPGEVVPMKSFQGMTMGGRTDMVFAYARVPEKGDGRQLELVFVPKSQEMGTLTENQLLQKAEEEGITLFELVQRMEAESVYISEDNPMAGWLAILSPSERNAVVKRLEEDGGGPFDMTRSGLNMFLYQQGDQQQQQQGALDPRTGSNPSTPPQRQAIRIIPGLQ